MTDATAGVHLTDADLPTRICDLRRRRGLSLRDAAAQIGISFNTLKRIEDGANYENRHNAALTAWLATDDGSCSACGSTTGTRAARAARSGQGEAVAAVADGERYATAVEAIREALSDPETPADLKPGLLLGRIILEAREAGSTAASTEAVAALYDVEDALTNLRRAGVVTEDDTTMEHVLAIVRGKIEHVAALTAASTETVEARLTDGERCANCGHRLTIHSGGATIVHAEGPQAGKGTCALNPYGAFMATRAASTTAQDAEGDWGREAPHTVTQYGTTNCPVEGVRAEVDDDDGCSACGAKCAAQGAEGGEVPSVAQFNPDESEANHVARVLMHAWHDAEGKWPTASVVATFADMAHAVLADRAEGGEVERLRAVRALADEWQGELDSGAIRDPDARYCWTTAVRELRAVLDRDTPDGGGE